MRRCETTEDDSLDLMERSHLDTGKDSEWAGTADEVSFCF